MKRRPASQLEAYDATGERRLTDEDRLLLVIQEAGRAETLAELTLRFNNRYGTTKPESTISGRLNGLAAKGKITTYLNRQCSVSKRMKQTWYLTPESDGVQLTLGRAS